MKFSISILIIIIIYGCSVNRQIKPIQQEYNLPIYKDNSINDLIDLGDNWFQVTVSVVIENITPEKAKEMAIQKACKKAIEYFSGVEISGRILNIQAENQNQILIDNYSSITQQTAQGIIIDKEILKDEIISKENQLIKVITIKVKVDKQKGEKDPSFQVTANLNSEYFKDVEEMELSVKSSKDCYLTIFNICSNDSVYVIFPNEYRKSNFLKSGENFRLPNSDDKKIGLYFPVNLLPNKNEDVELIKVIATKQKIDFSSVYSFSAYGTYQTAYIDLQNWLLKIPRNEIEEVDLQYFISK